LLRGKRLAVLPTLDEQFLGVRDALPSPDERLATEDRTRYGWFVVSVSTGEQVAALPYEPGTQALTVRGGRAHVLVARAVRGPVDGDSVQRRSLKAIDLKAGKTLWERRVAGKPAAPPPPIRGDK